MSTEEQARERMAQHRQQEEKVKESILIRSEAEVENPSAADSVTQEKARELMTEQRQDEAQMQASMLNRAEAKVGIDRSDHTSSQETA